MWVPYILLLASAVTGQHNEKSKKLISVLLVNGLYTGHLFPLVSLGEELVGRGHKVTLIANVLNGSHTYPDFPERVGINFVSSGYDKYWTQESLSEFNRQLSSGDIEHKEMLTKMHEAISTSTLQVKNKVEEIGADQFDIIICDAGVQMIGTYFHVLGKKAVILNPMLSVFVRTDLEWPTPQTLTGQSDDLSFLERFLNVVILRPLLHIGFTSLFGAVIGEDEGYSKVLQNRGGIDYFYYVGTHMPMIITSSFGFEFPRTRLPLVEYVGPVLFHTPPELKKDLKQWLDSKPPQTVIYISMGTTATLSTNSVEAIYDGIFRSTSYSAVWLMKQKDRNVLQKLDTGLYTDRLYLADWVAQQSLLRHRAISMSIVHCGMNSVHESIFNSHPVICFPSVFDQFDVAKRVVSAGVGVSMYGFMDKLLGNTIVTPQMVVNAINTVAADNYCTHNISRVRKTFHLAGGARRAADLIEFYEEVGYDHLVPAYIKYNWSWVQYYNCDVWMVLVGTGVLVMWCCWRLFKSVRNWSTLFFGFNA